MRRLLLALFLALATPAFAQDRATLVADRVELVSTDLLVATGHVEVFFKGQRLTATEVRYDAKGDRLSIAGPIRIDDGAGNLITADSADLSADLTEGLLTSARLMMADRLQMAAAEISRSEGGRITALRQVAASTCRICGNGPPLWEIRAKAVVHDAVAQRIRFSSATLRFAGVPVLWMPFLRVPDPTVKRASGLLVPQLQSSTALGTGLKLPFFITLGPSRDLTLTPFFSDAGTRSLGLRWRQAFRAGTLELTGALGRDEIQPDSTRGYLQAKGQFRIGDWNLALDGTAVTDRAYLQDYGISDADRLASTLSLGQASRDQMTELRLTFLRTLRETENNRTQPSLVASAETVRRVAVAGGVMTGFGSFGAARRGSVSGLDADDDGIADGRDLTRFSAGLGWERRWISAGGLVFDAGAQAGADLYGIAEDEVFEGTAARRIARGGLRLSWPLLRRDAGGTTLVEPALQLTRATAHVSGPIPDEDSRLVEFDEGNLFALDRFPGADAVETGTRLNLGLTLEREAARGARYGLVLGRIVTRDGISANAGSAALRADWLVVTHASLTLAGTQVSTTNRALFGDDLSLARLESRFALAGSRGSLSGGYEFLPEDAARGRTQEAREFVLDATARLSEGWTLALSDRYDLSSKTTRAALGLGFRNECLAVDLSVSRRFTSSSIVEASSSFGLTVQLLGFGGASATGEAATCRR